MLKSNYSIIDDVIIFEVKADDLYINNFGYEFSDLISKLNKNKVVFNLDDFNVITSDDIKNLEKIVNLLKLNGCDCIICGINPYSASLIYTFVEEIRFETSLNIKGALDEFSNR